MARFSLGGDDDSDEGGPSRRPYPNPKRIRIDSTSNEHRSERSEEPESGSEDRGEREEEQESDHESEQQLSEEEEEEEDEEEVPEDVDDDDDDDDDDLPIILPIARPMVNDVAEVVADNGGNVDGCHVMTLSDPDVLDCPICLDPLSIPVFQCENGHIACSLCSTKVRNKCPSCTFPIGYNRCRAIEKVIESVKISCRNFKYGCMEKTSYCNKNEHENMCAYAPCSCPQLYCSFIGSSKQLSEHFTSKHPYIAKRFHFDNTCQILIDPNQKCVILQENGGQLFILNNTEFQSVGNIITVSCIRPSTLKEEFSYNVVAKKDGCLVKLESVADNVVARAENPNWKKFLMVPRDFVDPCGKLKVEVNILNQLPNTPPRAVTLRFRDILR